MCCRGRNHAMTGSDHRCRSGRRCAARTATEPAATSKPDTLCPACITEIQALRDKLGAFAVAVGLFIGIKPVTAWESKVNATKTPSSPLNLGAEELLGDLADVRSRAGTYLVRDLVAQPAKRFKVWRGDVEQLVYYDGVDIALQIRSVCRRAETLLGFSPVWQRRSAPCWACGVPALGQFTGSVTVECSACGTRKTDVDYQQYCVELMTKGRA